MKTLNTIIFALASNRGRQVSMASRIGGMIFLLVCAAAMLVIGLVTKLWLLVLLGGIGTVMYAVILAILIIINVRRNQIRW
jgi:hypothetical protein